ncbi:MlaC/ttg2D family ABC transporter substrate-binding protein [Wolbachia endosymbiont of Pentidionis agamae]|uniref:MlaC/ttg2D family ABC transporter substrate-binding protein n=1 Tax=Wolbachia endosymbiont of Pentidionis agamae TaxID=3110435 RepID=UPI002FD053F1
MASEGPIVFITNLKEKLENAGKSQSSKYQKLGQVIKSNVDMENISRFVMGRYWNIASQEERKNFLIEYEKHFLKLCANNLHRYMKNSEMIIMSVRKIDNFSYLINTRLTYNDDELFNISYKVIQKEDSFLISDIIIAGISLVINQRTKFGEKFDSVGIINTIEELNKQE